MGGNNIAIVGAGAVGFHLAHAMVAAGHGPQTIISRDISEGKRLAKICHAEFLPQLSSLPDETDLVFLTVPDGAILETTLKLPDSKAVVVHTSGSFTFSSETSVKRSWASFYPLQTFTKGKSVEWREIPVFCEASSDEVLNLVMELGRQLGSQPIALSGEKRKVLHIAAVFAANFSTALMQHAETLLVDAGLSFDHLKPLVEENLGKVIALGPSKALTGPAIRKDFQTIEKHLAYLDAFPLQQEIYKVISDSIILNNDSD